jgi:hypothetical protein
MFTVESKWIANNCKVRPMSVTFQPSKKELPTRTARGRVFDDAIKKLAPTVSHLQAGECPAIHELAEYLNSLGLVAPSGGPFTYTTTRRVLIRLAEMGLCLAPMTLSETKGRLRRKKTALKAMVFQKYEK